MTGSSVSEVSIRERRIMARMHHISFASELKSISSRSIVNIDPSTFATPHDEQNNSPS